MLSHVAADTAPWEQRLRRDGWHLVERGFDPRTHSRIGDREIWRKPNAAFALCRQIEDVDFRRYGGPYAETFWLETADDLIPLGDATWADWDRGNRLAIARDGKLLAATPHGKDLLFDELYDFNPHRPQQVATPDWARRW